MLSESNSLSVPYCFIEGGIKRTCKAYRMNGNWKPKLFDRRSELTFRVMSDLAYFMNVGQLPLLGIVGTAL